MNAAKWWDIDLAAREAKRAGEYERAETLFLESLRLALPSADSDYQVSILYNTIADFYREWGKLDTAIEFAREGVALDRRKYNSLLRNALIFLAMLLGEQGTFDEAIGMAEEALPLSEKEFGPDHYLYTHNRLLLESLKKKAQGIA